MKRVENHVFNINLTVRGLQENAAPADAMVVGDGFQEQIALNSELPVTTARANKLIQL